MFPGNTGLLYACDGDPMDGPLADADSDGVANGEDDCPVAANADAGWSASALWLISCCKVSSALAGAGAFSPGWTR